VGICVSDSEASVAAPFVSKGDSISCVTLLLRWENSENFLKIVGKEGVRCSLLCNCSSIWRVTVFYSIFPRLFFTL
jgi:hypothetical protein